MAKPIVTLMKILLAVAFAVFAWGVGESCYYSIQNTPGLMPPILGSAVLSMSAVFATNFGAIVGIGIFSSESLKDEKFWNPFNALKTQPSAAQQAFSLQILSCYFYVICLTASGIVWGIMDFAEDPVKIVPLLPELGKSLIGILVGALGASLGLVAIKKQRSITG